MILVFEDARLIDPEDGTEMRGCLVVEDGVIADVGGAAPRAGTRIDCGGLALAPGLIDIGVKVGEPGERHKEGFRSAGRAPAAGGVTTIVTRADTTPALDSPEGLAFARSRRSPRVRMGI